MKTDTMILLALAAVAIYFVTKENSILPAGHSMFPPANDDASGDAIGA